jgi:hypothetical protein
MIEYFVIRALWSSLGNNARAKGHTAIGYQLMLVGLWITGLFTGLILGLVLSEVFNSKGDQGLLIAVVTAYVTAGAGAGLSFLIVHLLPDQSDPGAMKIKEKFDDPDAFRHFNAHTSDRKNKDRNTDPKEEARQDERYKPE